MAPKLPNQVITEMAKQEHRMMHYVWHGVRNSWARLSGAAKKQIRKIDPGWEPPRPGLDSNSNPNRDNNSGEDFLYMHRQMIAGVNKILAQAAQPDYPKVQGWKKIPAPGDPDYPVPPLAGFEELKSDDYYQNTLAPWESKYKSKEYLKANTLGQLGCDLEFTIHNNLHMRFAADSPVGYRPNTPITATVDPQWNSPVYDFLGDTYSSHVSPIFWRLHGWVDDRIKDWKKANAVNGDIVWKGTWIGPAGHMNTPHMMNMPTSTQQQDKMVGIAKVLGDEVGFTGFFRPSAKSAGGR